ncbi:MAG: hypothetical protein HWE26_10135 [Alteromonadaceae bacterium]|nr:hypothetical protein [Alteromonadaceae bacterium]
MYLKFLSVLVAVSALLSACGDGSESAKSNVPSVPIANNLPVANAGANQEVDIETLIFLDASESFDSDGDTLSYQWRLRTKPVGSAVLLKGDTSEKLSFIPDKYGDYEIELTAFDGEDYSVPTQVIITAKKTPIDCNKLDPNKIYLFGTLQEDTRSYAIADPTDPTDFCIGFVRDHNFEGQITSSGRYIYAYSSFDDKNIYAFSPDELIKNEDGYWVYPQFSLDNDTIIHTTSLEGCGFSRIKVIPGTDEVVYSCPNRILNKQGQVNYYDIGSSSINELLSVFADTSMLIFTTEDGLVYIDPMRNETIISLPFSFNWTYYFGARQYVDPSTNNDSIWLAFYRQNTDAESLVRISVDLETFEVKEDGRFADSPNGFIASIKSSKFDLEGNLWQFGYEEGNRDNTMIVKRPIGASDSPSTVIYKHSDFENDEVYIGPAIKCEQATYGEECDDGIYRWFQHDNLFIKLDGFSMLITGT